MSILKLIFKYIHNKLTFRKSSAELVENFDCYLFYKYQAKHIATVTSSQKQVYSPNESDRDLQIEVVDGSVNTVQSSRMQRK